MRLTTFSDHVQHQQNVTISKKRSVIRMDPHSF